MIAQDVINVVDRLKPNAYSVEDKLDWISDVDTYIRSEIIKHYSNYMIEDPKVDEVYTLPDYITFENIEHVLFGSEKINKIDFKSYGINGYRNKITIYRQLPKKIVFVYLVKFPRYRHVTYVSEPGEITFWSNAIETDGEPFDIQINDTINISGCIANEGNNKDVLIIGGTTKKLVVEDDSLTEWTESTPITFERILNDILIASEPYDKMYKEYLFAMIDFNNREYESYNNNMIMYNTTLEAFANWYKQRSPVNLDSKIYNIW